MPVKRIRHMNYVLIHLGWGDKMRTCWLFDHPAHVRLLAPFVRDGETSDIIIACDRIEVGPQLLDAGDGILPRRQTVFVPRPVGKRRYRKAIQRLSIVKKNSSRKGNREDNFCWRSFRASCGKTPWNPKKNLCKRY